MSEFKRQCPVCSNDIYHTSKCNLIKKDADRMQDLLKYTGCKIIRYNELKKTIKEYTL